MTSLDLGDLRAPLAIRINRRARQFIVRVDSVAGLVKLTAPSRRSLPDALRFARSRAPWIKKRLDHGTKAKPFAPGAVIPFAGVPHRIVRVDERMGVRLADAASPTLQVGGRPEHVNRRVVDWLKREARRRLAERVEAHAAELGRRPANISVRDTRTQWGSCSKNGALSFSWRLILAPPEILDYVAAHECAHLLHLNHSRAFWRALASLGVDARAARDWFRAHGAELHAYGMEPPKSS